ncbi:MAG: hypothetical protein KIT87_07030 [Anaerolineae bacterium]|nr:hypothetical protein [Anaerolineae bacterium]
MKRFRLSFVLIGALSALALVLTLGGLPLAQAGVDQDTPPTQTALAPTLIATGGPTPTIVGDSRRQSYVWVSREPAAIVPYDDDVVTEFPDGTTLLYINIWIGNESQPVDYQIETRNGFGALQSPRLEGRYDPAWGVITVPWTPGSGSIPRAGNDYLTTLYVLKNIAGTILRIPYQDRWRIGSNLRFNQSSYSDAGPASLEVIDDGRNQNPNTQETISVRVWSDGGDATGFSLTLKESSPNSGRFVTGAAVGLPNLSFCSEAGCSDAAATKLAVNPNGDRIHASYKTASNLDLTAQADWTPSGGGGSTPRPPTPTGPPTATPTRTPTLPGGAVAVTLTPVPTPLAPGVFVPRVGYIRGVRNRSGLPPINFPDFNPDMSVGYYDASTEPVWLGFIQFDYTWPANAQLVNADLAITGSRNFNTALKGDTGQWRVDVINMGDKIIDYTMVFTDVAGADTLATLSPILAPDMLQPQVTNRLFFSQEARQAVQSQLESQRRVVFRVSGPASVSFREQNIFSWATGWSGSAPSSEAGPQLRLNYIVQPPTGTATATSAASLTATTTATASRTWTPPPPTTTRTPSATYTSTASATAPPSTPTPTPPPSVTATLTAPPLPSATASVSPTPTVALPTFLVTGLVEDCGRTRLTNARISIFQTAYSALTQEGIYVMPSVSLPDGVYTLLAVRGDLAAIRQATLGAGQAQYVVNFTDDFCLRSAGPAASATASPTATLTVTSLPPTLTPTFEPTVTETAPATETVEAPKTPTLTATPAALAATATATAPPTASPTPQPPTATSPPTQTWTPSATPSATPRATRTVTPSLTVTPTSTLTPTASATATASPTATFTPTATVTPTATLTATATRTATATASPTPTITPTRVTNVYLDKTVYATYNDQVRVTVFDLARYASSFQTSFSAPIEIYSDASAARIRLNLYRDDTVTGQYIPDRNSLVGFCEECNETDVVNVQLKVRSGSIIRAEYKSLDGTLYTTTARWQFNPLPTETVTPTLTPPPTSTATRTVTPTPTETPHPPTLTATATEPPPSTATLTPTVEPTRDAPPTPTATLTPSRTLTATPSPTHAAASPTWTVTASVTAPLTATPTLTPPALLPYRVYLPLVAGGQQGPFTGAPRPAAVRTDVNRLADAVTEVRRLWMALNSLFARK